MPSPLWLLRSFMAGSPHDLEAAALLPPDLKTVWRGKGCDDCRGTGYRGRVGIFELFEMDSRMRELCFRGAGTLKLRGSRSQSGSTTGT